MTQLIIGIACLANLWVAFYDHTRFKVLEMSLPDKPFGCPKCMAFWTSIGIAIFRQDPMPETLFFIGVTGISASLIEKILMRL